MSIAAVVVASVIAARVGAELGTFGEWTSGAGTVTAVGVSLYLLHQGQVDRRQDEAERERRQALRVSCWITTVPNEGGSLADPADIPCVRVRNDSDLPIYSVVLQPEPFDPDGPAHPQMLAMMPPSHTEDLEWPYWPDEPSPARPMVNFTDAEGIVWQRDGIELRELGRGFDTANRGLAFDMKLSPFPWPRR